RPHERQRHGSCSAIGQTPTVQRLGRAMKATRQPRPFFGETLAGLSFFPSCSSETPLSDQTGKFWLSRTEAYLTTRRITSLRDYVNFSLPNRKTWSTGLMERENGVVE